MEQKKSDSANINKKTGFFMEVGLAIVLAIVLYAFELGNPPEKVEEIDDGTDVIPEEQMQVTRELPPEPPPPPPPPQVIEVINIVEDNVEIEEFEFDNLEVDVEDEFELFTVEEEDEAVEEEVFVIVEDMPKFRGGDLNDFRIFVQKSLKYPEIAAENGIDGRVFIQFAVNSKGEVVDVNVVRGVDPALDAEAKRVVKNSPKWVPGKQRGRPVKVQFTFPIVFVLQ